MWECPRCDRRFGQANRPHVCAPAMAIDAYFVDAEPGDREIYEAVAEALIDCGPVEIEAVSVGIFFKRSRTFVELRPRKRGMACSMILPARARVRSGDAPDPARTRAAWPTSSRSCQPTTSTTNCAEWLAMAYDAASARVR